MIDYHDPKRWIIVAYKACSGGKFFCSCLMTIDRIAHWDSRVENNEITYQQWIHTQWNHASSEKWLAFEPMHDWHNTFFSRTFPRGNNLSLEEYNSNMNQSVSDYFKEVWKKDKLILDFNNKFDLPDWWQDAYKITLDAEPHCEIHKNFLLKKLYPYDAGTKMGTVILDKGIKDQKQQNANVYRNQFEFGPFPDEDRWYDYICKNDIRLNWQFDHVDIWLTDLLDYNRLLHHVQKIAADLDSTFSLPDLRYVYDYWMEKNKT